MGLNCRAIPRIFDGTGESRAPPTPPRVLLKLFVFQQLGRLVDKTLSNAKVVSLLAFIRFPRCAEERLF